MAETPAERLARLHATTEAHRALGGYFVSFSRLVFTMRLTITMRFSTGPSNEQALIQLVLGEATANQIANTFFAMCRDQLETDGVALDKSETKIANSLRNSVKDAIERRNEIAHADLLVPHEIHFVRPSRAVPWVTSEMTSDKLDALREGLIELYKLVDAYGAVSLGTLRYDTPRLRVSDLLTLKDGVVAYDGPHASGIHLH